MNGRYQLYVCKGGSPNLKLYTFVCNTLNLHDTEVERSPNLKLYTFVCNTLNLHDTDQCRTQS